ncbi:unnamed protein product [Rotaria sordida]|uniref:SHSP domain-containing protein n=1 Tax=Rotaria sordida TaxID=392033 RepID=A0A815EGN3_9BILA|nr:unnamed protein product [Rotaria sordida]
MSTNTIPTSSFLPRPYIGSCHNRYFIDNKLSTSSLLLNNSCFSTISPSKLFLPNQSKKKIYLSNEGVSTNISQEPVLTKYISSPLLLDEQQLHQRQTTKSSLSPSSSSLFIVPTTENITSRTYYNRSPHSFVKEQQKIRHQQQNEQQHSQGQFSSSENRNNQYFLSEQLKCQQERKQPSIYNHYIDLNDTPEKNKSFSSSSLLNNNITLQHNNNNQSYHLTSTPFQLPVSSHYSTTTTTTTTDNNLRFVSSNKNNYSKSLSDISNNILNQLTTPRYSSDLGMGRTTTYSYDQRITDQGDKYIIQLKTDDYQENEFTITPHYYQNQLIIDAKHSEEDSNGGYIRRELHKVFNIPKHFDLNKYTYTYNKNTQELTIEMPCLQPIINEKKNNPSFISPIQNTTQSLTFSYDNRNLTNEEKISPTTYNQTDDHHHHRNVTNTNNKNDYRTGINNNSTITNNTLTTAPRNELLIETTKPFDYDLFHRSAFRPQIIQTISNEKNLQEKKLLMSLDLSDYQPEDIKVSIQGQELIVKAEKTIETNTRKSRISFFQSTNLPPQTDIEHLKSNYIDGKLIIEAPYLEQRIKTNQHQEKNGQKLYESQQTSIHDDPFQQRTQTITELVHVRRL